MGSRCMALRGSVGRMRIGTTLGPSTACYLVVICTIQEAKVTSRTIRYDTIPLHSINVHSQQMK